jgi:hypothetical protein
VADGVSRGLAGADLVIIGLPGVQRFIAEARSTGDVRAASQVFAGLAAKAAEVCRDEPDATLIFPVGPAGGDGMPNRVVALFPAGQGAEAARKAQAEITNTWQGWVRRAFRQPDGADLPETYGMPVVQWVAVPAGPGGYPDQWETAQRLLAARRRVRDFGPGAEWPERELCSIAPRWPAVAEPPAGLREHEKATLSAASWVKRRWRKLDRDLDGFPSTASIASAPFRRAVLERADHDEGARDAFIALTGAARQVIGRAQGGDVRESRLPGFPEYDEEHANWFASTGGPWVYPDQWQLESLVRELKVDAAGIAPAARAGLAAATLLRDLMKKAGAPPLARYLAVLAADLDSMGLFLAGEVASRGGSWVEPSPAAHQGISQVVRELAVTQRELLEGGDLLGVPVYAGGDDLLAFVPAATALTAAQRCHDAVPPALPWASTAVLFFHYHASLQGAVTRARRLLEDAKGQSRAKHGLAVGYLRRSGVSEASVQPWPGPQGQSTAAMFGIFTASQEHQLSPRLLADLDRDGDELARLSVRHPDIYRAELGRLVGRHTAGEPARARASAAVVAETLEWLGKNEAARRLSHAAQDRGDPGDRRQSRPQAAARVGVFLRQEAR